MSGRRGMRWAPANVSWNPQGCGRPISRLEDHLNQSPILRALSSIQRSGARTLLMGGQACIFYGAAEFSRDLDLLILADATNLPNLVRALDALEAEEREERRKDREYWAPLKRELEEFRLDRRRQYRR